jgi:hypothetical protein
MWEFLVPLSEREGSDAVVPVLSSGLFWSVETEASAWDPICVLRVRSDSEGVESRLTGDENAAV